MPDRGTKAAIVATENQKRRDHFRPQSVLEFEGRAPASSFAFSREIEPNNVRVAAVDA